MAALHVLVVDGFSANTKDKRLGDAVSCYCAAWDAACDPLVWSDIHVTSVWPPLLAPSSARARSMK